MVLSCPLVAVLLSERSKITSYPLDVKILFNANPTPKLISLSFTPVFLPTPPIPLCAYSEANISTISEDPGPIATFFVMSGTHPVCPGSIATVYPFLLFSYTAVRLVSSDGIIKSFVCCCSDKLTPF